MRPPLSDRHGRRIRYLRLSLTDKCNFRCGFCRPDCRVPETGRPPALTTAERLRLCSVFHRLGVDNFKITGGEPFMDPDAVAVMDHLKNGLGAASVTVTTNGTTLDRHAERLAAVGVDGVNISLNAMSQEVYRAFIGCDFDLTRILDNALLAKRLGLRVKLNMVPIRGVNDGDILPLLRFALAHELHLRFIELMPIGKARDYAGVSFAEILGMIEERYGETSTFPGSLGNGPATYFTVPGHDARIGFIAAVSDGFCGKCNRIRLTSDGFLKTCLHHPDGTDLAGPLRSGETDEELTERIRDAVTEKPERHRFEEAAGGVAAGEEPMFRIGG